MVKPRMTKEDKARQAEWDANTLAEANVIKGDKPRLNAAKTSAKTQAKDKKAEAKAMTAVARVPVKKSPPRKSAPRKTSQKKR